MKITILTTTILFIMLAGVYLLHGQTEAESPKLLYQECQKLQAAIEDVDNQIKEINYQMERTRKAIANYHYVRTRNTAIIEEHGAFKHE